MSRSLTIGDGVQRTEDSRAISGRIVSGLGFPLSAILCSLALLLAAAPTFAQATIFPDRIGLYEKKAPKTMGLPDRDLLTEYALEATESADFVTVAEAPEKKRFSATAWRLMDSTFAYAWYQAKRAPGATPTDFSANAVRTSDGILFAFGNYVIQFTGGQPDPADLQFLYNSLPRFQNAPLPTLLKLFPTGGRVTNSERYILGPVSLQRFAPEIPPSVAAFRLGAEAQLVKYKNAKGDINLAVFSYPTPTMARDQAAEFQKVPNSMVKRTGSLVVVTVNPADRDVAEGLLGKVNYQADVTLNEKPPGADLRKFSGAVVSMIMLSGVLMFLCVIAGVGFGGFRVIKKKFRKGEDPEAMITLHLD